MANKTVENDASVRDFLDAVEPPIRKRDAFTALEMFERVTGCAPKMWGDSIVGFGKYQYTYESGRSGEWLNVGFSPRKSKMTLYVMGLIADDDPIRERIGKYKTGVGCLYVNKFEDVDLAVVEELIAQSYQATIDKYGAC
ncbi:MAG: DUF1801 domain-containing protein [Pseudomonadota bacterium]